MESIALEFFVCIFLIIAQMLWLPAVIAGNLILDGIQGDPISVTDVPVYQVIGGGFMSMTGNWFFGGNILSNFVSRAELLLYGSGLVAAQQTFELAVDVIVDGEADNLSSPASYVTNMLLGGISAFNDWNSVVNFVYETGQNITVNWLNEGNCSISQ